MGEYFLRFLCAGAFVAKYRANPAEHRQDLRQRILLEPTPYLVHRGLDLQEISSADAYPNKSRRVEAISAIHFRQQIPRCPVAASSMRPRVVRRRTIQPRFR
jgi:hypothetical protein